MCREIVEQILEAAASDEALRNRLMSSPAKVMREAGFVIQEESAANFDMFFRDEVSAPMRTYLQTPNAMSFMTVSGAACAACKVAAWVVGTAVVVAAAVGAASLTIANPAVVGLAAFMGITTAQALVIIGASAGVAAGDVRAFVGEICTKLGICP